MLSQDRKEKRTNDQVQEEALTKKKRLVTQTLTGRPESPVSIQY